MPKDSQAVGKSSGMLRVSQHERTTSTYQLLSVRPERCRRTPRGFSAAENINPAVDAMSRHTRSPLTGCKSSTLCQPFLIYNVNPFRQCPVDRQLDCQFLDEAIVNAIDVALRSKTRKDTCRRGILDGTWKFSKPQPVTLAQRSLGSVSETCGLRSGRARFGGLRPTHNEFNGKVKWVQIDVDGAAKDVDHMIGAEDGSSSR
jgi:hypothetical protein